jgi:uncharacterized membrane protein YoaK (UPF0700 family)
MSGNSAKLGVRLARGQLLHALPLALAVGAFVFSIALGTAVLELLSRRGVRSVAGGVLTLELALVLAFMLYGLHASANGYVLIALAVTAFGFQAATVQQVRGRTVRTTYVSGVLTSLAQDLVNVIARPPAGRSYVRDVLGVGEREDSRRRALVLAAVWFVYAGGAVLGAFLDDRWRLWALAVPAAILAALVLVDLRRPLYR